jgi:hypothetical protein
MYLVKNKKSPNYQLVYFRNGKRTTVSTGITNKKEAKKFFASFYLERKRETPAKKTSIRLSSFIAEYKTYVSNTYTEKYLKKAVTPSFNRLTAFLPDIPIKIKTPIGEVSANYKIIGNQISIDEIKKPMFITEAMIRDELSKHL